MYCLWSSKWTGLLEMLLHQIGSQSSEIDKDMYSQTCVKQATLGKPKSGCFRQVLAYTGKVTFI